MKVITLAALTLLALAPAARAADLPCAPAEPGTVSLDGLADDWQGVAAATAGDEQSGVTLRCNTEGKVLYLAIVATDERVVRTPQARAGEDHVTLRLGGKSITIFPPMERINGKLVPALGRLAATTSDKGFVMELAIPLAKLGLGAHPERIPYAVRFDDCDSAAALKTEHTSAVEGDLAFTAGAGALDTFLADHGLSRSTIRWQHTVKSGNGAAQLVLAGKFIAAIDGAYAFVELPVADGKDVTDPQLVDLAGDGRSSLLLRYTERGEGGSREVLAAFRPAGDRLQRVFAVEIGKRLPQGRLSTRVTLKRRGKATDLAIDALPAQGLTEATYQEAPATDVVPILLPWSSDKKATFSFSGDEYKRR